MLNSCGDPAKPLLKITMMDVTDGTSNTLMVGERDMTNQVAGIWPGRDANGVGSVLGRPTWPINTKYAGGTTCCAPFTPSPAKG